MTTGALAPFLLSASPEPRAPRIPEPHMINVTLPDGSRRDFETPSPSCGSRRLDRRRPGKGRTGRQVDGKLVDTSRRIDHDARLEIVTEKQPEALEVIRHSTAHLLHRPFKPVSERRSPSAR